MSALLRGPLIKNRTDVAALQKAGALAAQIMAQLLQSALPGVALSTINKQADLLLAQNRASAPFKRYEGFKYATCLSLNEGIVNGPPKERGLIEGDLLKLALGVEIGGMHAKIARTLYVSANQAQPSAALQTLIHTNQAITQNLPNAFGEMKTAKALAKNTQALVKKAGLTLLSTSVGCFTGKQLHLPPELPCFAEQYEADVLIEPGSAVIWMPMLSLGQADEVVKADDGWTLLTQDGALASHFADTYWVNPDGQMLCLTADKGAPV